MKRGTLRHEETLMRSSERWAIGKDAWIDPDYMRRRNLARRYGMVNWPALAFFSFCAAGLLGLLAFSVGALAGLL